MLWAATAAQLGGGVLLALGAEKIGAWLLLCFLVAITPVMHNPTVPGEIVGFMKNLSIAGGLLYVSSSSSRSSGKAKTS